MIHSHLIAKSEPRALSQNMLIVDDIRLTVLSETLFRIEQDIHQKFCDQATQSIWFRNTPAVTFTVERSKKGVVVKTEKATLMLAPDVLSSVVTVDGKRVMLSKIKNLPGAYRSLDRCDGDTYIEEDMSTHPIRLDDGIVSRSGVGLYNDADSLILDQNGKLLPRQDDTLDLYVFAHGKDYRAALRDLFTVSGKVPQIPRFALGNWWSRYHEYTEKEYLHIIDKLAQRDIPLTVATIDMDWHWSKTLDARKKITESGKNDDFHGGASGWTGYSWNTDLFPDYRSFLKKIKERNLSITLNLHPADGIRYFEDQYEEMAKTMGIDPATEQAIPFDFTSDDFINAYFEILHKPYEHDGVDFWWIDWQQGTQTSMPGLDPLWALNHYHTLDNALQHQSLILSRYCGIGSHRYPIGFSGDTMVTWKSLRYIPYFTAMGTNAGYTWWSHDIGGHKDGFKDDELYARYVQFGTFSPINRLHCNSAETCTKEPIVYMNGKGLIAEEFLRLRHRMIPFLYSASYDTHHNGAALIEPMYYAYPDEKEAYRCPEQYLFGNQLIVAPITKKSNREGLCAKRVWLPAGRWTDIFTGDEYDGGKWVEMVRWTDTIPVLAKSGGFFVLDGRRHTNKIDNPEQLEVMVFNGTGTYTLHEDGTGGEMHTHFASAAEEGKQVLTISVEGNSALVPHRTYRLKFCNIAKGAVQVTANATPVECETDDAGDCLEITLSGEAMQTYTVSISHTADPARYRNNRLLYNLIRIEGEARPKERFKRDLLTCTDEEVRARIDENQAFSAMQKKRLKEAW